MTYYYTRPGWNVETTHPIEPGEDGPVCEVCASLVAPTTAFAEAQGSTAHGHMEPEGDGTSHLIVVRRPANGE